MKYLIGIDVRIDGVDALLVDEKGVIVQSETEQYQSMELEAGWLEQDPSDWWAAVSECIRRIVARTDPAQIVAVGLCGQLHGLVALDEQNHVIRNAILWNDDRNAAEYDVIIADADDAEENGDKPRHKPFFPRFVESKMLWMKKYEPENYERIAKFIMPKDYIRYKLTGQVNATEGDAAKAGFFKTEEKNWDTEIIENIGVDVVVLPPLVPSNVPCGTVCAVAHADTGLPEGIPVYGASEDAVLESVGMSLVHPNTLGIVLGASGIVIAQTKGIPDVAGGRLESAVSQDGKKNVVYGRELSCVDSLRWAQDALYGDEDNPLETMEHWAERAPIGCHGVIFLPYLMGERSPNIDPDAKAVFYGLSVLARSKDLARSVMEGIAFGLADIYALICKANHDVKIEEIVLTGQACVYDLIKHIIADVFNIPVKLYEGAQQGMAYGAALVAGVGEGCFLSYEEAAAIHRVAEVIEPVPANHEKYMEGMHVYDELYKNLRKTFEKTSY